MKHVHDDEPALAPALMATLRDEAPRGALRDRTVRALHRESVFDARQRRRARAERRRRYALGAIAAAALFGSGFGAGTWAVRRNTTGAAVAPTAATDGPASLPAAAKIQDAARSYVDALALATADDAEGARARAVAMTSFPVVIEQMVRVVPGDLPNSAAVAGAPTSTSTSRRSAAGSIIWY
ncbi:MAG TPA: hypothetical protein VMH39_00375 [Gemmatimonadaceae bacterium]|nr:hypothetical protein [Gemmatimonadaceae bacterium]